MKVLSLFDGMSCGMIAMKLAGLTVDRYDAWEIDKYAVTASKHNFPEIVHHGDVFDADFTEYRGYDFLVGGSPCTYWSIAQSPDKRETTASGIGWDLFRQYVRALHDAQPRMFIYENNKSMSKEIRASITEAFGFEPICINSALVSAQNRQRLYWVGVRNADGTYRKANIEQPADRGILLKDVLNSAVAWHDNSQHTNALTTVSKDKLIAEPICVNAQSGCRSGERRQPSRYDRIYSTEGKGTAVTTAFQTSVEEPAILTENEMAYMTRDHGDRRWNHMSKPAEDEKSHTITANISKGVPYNCCAEPTANGQRVYTVQDGQIEVNGKRCPIKLRDGKYIIRKLTVTECMRLQTVPEWYDFSCVSNTQAYKMLGNGWTCEVIAHLIRGALRESETKEEQ